MGTLSPTIALFDWSCLRRSRLRFERARLYSLRKNSALDLALKGCGFQPHRNSPKINAAFSRRGNALRLETTFSAASFSRAAKARYRRGFSPWGLALRAPASRGGTQSDLKRGGRGDRFVRPEGISCRDRLQRDPVRDHQRSTFHANQILPLHIAQKASHRLARRPDHLRNLFVREFREHSQLPLRSPATHDSNSRASFSVELRASNNSAHTSSNELWTSSASILAQAIAA